MNRNQDQPQKRYMAGIDGLRAIAVLAVIAYHFHFEWAQGGLLGVGVFFVLSGYLITDQILMEWKRTQNISIWNFWKRRFRRLLPAMVCMLILVALWLVVTAPSRLMSLKGDLLSSLFYVNNWYLIFHEVSYFESFGPPSPIGHLWSLSIEEQFYVIWPVALLIALRRTPLRRKLIVNILVLAIVSVFLMGIIYVPGTDPSRVYYGTDTRAFAILIGAALAVGWPSWRLQKDIVPSARKLLDASGLLGLIILFILIIFANAYEDTLYPLGFLFLSLVSAIVIAVLVHPGSNLGRILGCRPLTWIGKRSYSLYVWHYPVIVLMSSSTDNGELGFIQIGVRLVIIFTLSIVSYKYIEEPIRRGYFIAQLRQVRTYYLFKPIVAAVLSSLAFMIILSWINDTSKVQSELSQPVVKKDVTQSENNNIVQTEGDDISQPEDDHINNNDEMLIHEEEGEGITVIGDSVIINVAPFLEDMLPGIVVDGKVGRQMSHAQQVVNELRTKGKLGERIILELGTNGPFNPTKLRSLLSSIKDAKQIYLVTTRVPKDWQNSVNNTLQEVADEFQNVKIIDWYSASENRGELFYQDGVHLTPEGSEYYASLLVKHLREDE